MVRRRLSGTLLTLAFLALASCGREGDMPESMEMPDSMPVVRALEDAESRNAMLDTMPGGEMARGDSTAEMELLKRKM